MARSITAIQQVIIDSIADDEVLSTKLNSSSKTAIYRLISFIVAAAIWMHETLWDQFKTDVEEILNTRQTHNLMWYSNMAKLFQYGYALHQDADYYDVVNEAAMIVAHSAVTENNGILIMKVAKESAGELTALSAGELTAFEEYIRSIKDAGVRISIISNTGDDLRLTLDVFYNPLVLDGNGKLLNDSSQEPAKDTLKEFIKNLPFNGEFIPTSLVDALQVAEGVDIPVILSCETRFGENEFTVVDGKVTPYSGYLTIADENLIINYRANVHG